MMGTQVKHNLYYKEYYMYKSYTIEYYLCLLHSYSAANLLQMKVVKHYYLCGYAMHVYRMIKKLIEHKKQHYYIKLMPLAIFFIQFLFPISQWPRNKVLLSDKKREEKYINVLVCHRYVHRYIHTYMCNTVLLHYTVLHYIVTAFVLIWFAMYTLHIPVKWSLLSLDIYLNQNFIKVNMIVTISHLIDNVILFFFNFLFFI